MVRGYMVGPPEPAAALAAVLAAVAPGCHAVIRNEMVQPVTTERIQHLEGAIAGRPTAVLTGAGRLRFIEPLECPTEDIVHQRIAVEVVTRPNLATFTVGVIAATIGGVMLTSGLFSRHPGTSPYTLVGVTGIAVGMPLAVGPWIGDGTKTVAGGDAPGVVRRPGPSQPCGEHPLAARSATLETAGLEIHGAIDRDGVFAVSPFQWIDAFGAATGQRPPASALSAKVQSDGGARTITTGLDTTALARGAAGFLAAADFDTRIEPLRLVPGIAPGALRASLVSTEHGPALLVVLSLRNDGPGDAWALRGQIAAPTAPAIDGRMIYVGHLAKGAQVSRELAIPLARAAAAALTGATLELSVELRDAHGTAPATPVRFRGALGEPAR